MYSQLTSFDQKRTCLTPRRQQPNKRSMLLPFSRSIVHIPAYRRIIQSRYNTIPTVMKFSNYALAAAVFASTANAFAGSQMTPRFGLQVRPTKTVQMSIL
jgi:hypothetical protein